MTERRTYLDANVLIVAWNGDDEARARARAILNDPNRRLVVSDFVQLEVLPKPEFYRQAVELAFMQAILAAAENIPASSALVRRAVALAGKHDLSPLDALHLAAASEAGVDELVTFERPEKPLCRQTDVQVVYLYVGPSKAKP